MKKNQLQPTPIIGASSLEKLEKKLNSPEYRDARLFVLVDSNTLTHCLPLFESIVIRAQEAEIIEVPGGQGNKDLDIGKGIWLSLLDLGANRDSVLLNLGGGSVSDLGGFAASTFMRGIRFFNIPTTLMGMCDAGFGGKCGLDLEGYKNLIGTFAVPEGVYVYPGFLTALPERELRSGFAEILKYALIADETLWDQLAKKRFHEITNWSVLLKKCADIKMSVIAEDPLEEGLRKVLNFGHTLGHALETLSSLSEKKPMNHGEAVAAGLICESYLSWKRQGLPEALLGEISDIILENFPFRALPGPVDQILTIMQSDKKNEQGQINFTLLAGYGQVLINQQCPESWIRESIAYYQSMK